MDYAQYLSFAGMHGPPLAWISAVSSSRWVSREEEGAEIQARANLLGPRSDLVQTTF